MQAEEVDPRLIALGLVPPPAAEPAPAAPPTSPPTTELHAAPAAAPMARDAVVVVDESPTPSDPESAWLAKIRRVAAATQTPRQIEADASGFVDERLAALTSVAIGTAKQPKTKAPKVKAPKIKAEKFKPPKVEQVKPPKVEQVKPAKVKPEKIKAEKIKPPKVKVEKAPPVPVEIFKPDPNATLVFVHTVRFGMRTIPLELWSDRVALGSRIVPWQAIRAVTARAGRVHIEAADRKASLTFVPSVDGVPEPMLAPLFAEIVLDGSAGAPPREKLARALGDGKADTKYRFRERDDQSLPILVLLITALATALLVVVIPIVVALPFRGGVVVGADTFLIYPRLSSFDPRTIVGAIASGMLASRLAMRAAAGRDLMLWAHGTAAGWNRATKLRGRVAKVIASHVLIHGRAWTIAGLAAIVLFLPSARERVTIDADGVHARAAVPFFDRDVPWSNVGKPILIDQGGTYDVVLTTNDNALIGGTIVDTRGSVFYGLSPYALAQFAERQRNAPH